MAQWQNDLILDEHEEFLNAWMEYCEDPRGCMEAYVDLILIPRLAHSIDLMPMDYKEVIRRAIEDDGQDFQLKEVLKDEIKQFINIDSMNMIPMNALQFFTSLNTDEENRDTDVCEC